MMAEYEMSEVTSKADRMHYLEADYKLSKSYPARQ